MERFNRWRLQDLLVRFRGLRVAPSRGTWLRLVGELNVHATGPDGRTLEDTYEVELLIPADFPRSMAKARETGGRIAPTFHKLKGDFLCLGARTDLRIRLVTSPTLLTFVEHLLIPYLYGHSYFKSFGVMPFDELEHGKNGLLQHFSSLFGAPSQTAALEFVRVASLRRRIANKLECPCGSRRRLGRCHNQRVNWLRKLLGSFKLTSLPGAEKFWRS